MAVALHDDAQLKHFERRTFVIMALVSCVVGCAAAVFLVYSDVFDWWSNGFWVACAVTGLIFLITSTWLFWWHMHTFQRLLDQQLAEEPPHITSEAMASSVRPPAVLPTDTLHIGLDQSDVGIVIFDSSQTIIYSNKKAPVSTDEDGTKHLDLSSAEAEKITEWVEQGDKKSAHTSRVWKRVPSEMPGEQKRKIYDVAASYNKGTEAETTLLFFDRSFEYLPEEDELDFISFAAHELRGPITVIKGYLDVLDDELKPVLEKDQAALMERLIVSANRLSSYINNILNASRYDRRHFQVHPVETSLKTIYTSVKDDMELRAAAQNRLLSVSFDDSLPAVAADKNAVGEVLSNLIDNAIKYSNEGGQVIVKARPIPGFVEVSITDRGIGMPSNVLPNLFHKFYRSHRSRETVAGTGIGLYICKAIINSHGGSISVRSTEHEGSTFTFTLPTYAAVADKLKNKHNGTTPLIRQGSGWIKNHSMYRG